MSVDVFDPESTQCSARFWSGRKGKLMVQHPSDLEVQPVSFTGADPIFPLRSRFESQEELVGQFPMFDTVIGGSEHQIQCAQRPFRVLDLHVLSETGVAKAFD